MTKVVSFKFDTALLERVDHEAKASGLNRSQFVFGLIERGLALGPTQEALEAPSEEQQKPLPPESQFSMDRVWANVEANRKAKK